MWGNIFVNPIEKFLYREGEGGILSFLLHFETKIPPKKIWEHNFIYNKVIK